MSDIALLDFGFLLRLEFEGQLVNLAGELERDGGCCDLRVSLVIALIAFQPKQYVSITNFSIGLANRFKLELPGGLKSLDALARYDCRAGIVAIG
jgi:hypothetical protein